MPVPLFFDKLVNPIVVAQTVGVAASCFFVGGNMCQSLVHVPAGGKLDTPAKLQFFSEFFPVAKDFFSGLCVVSIAGFATAAFLAHPRSQLRVTGLVSAAFCATAPVFTVVVIQPLFQKLLLLGKDSSKATSDQVSKLYNDWAFASSARAVLFSIGAVLGLMDLARM